MINLTKFYENPPSYENNCFESCNSHCCQLYKLTNQMILAPKDAVAIFLYDFELKWLVKNNHLSENFKKNLKTYEFLVDNVMIKYHIIQCGENGICPDHKFRPLSCHFYPSLPYFNKKGEILSIKNLSLFDDLYKKMDLISPCTLIPKFDIERYKKLVIPHLADKEFYFYTNLYLDIKDHILKDFKVKNQKTTPEETFREFENHYIHFLTNNMSIIKSIVKKNIEKFGITYEKESTNN